MEALLIMVKDHKNKKPKQLSAEGLLKYAMEHFTE